MSHDSVVRPRFEPRGAPGERLDPRDRLVEVEGFRQVVVCPEPQAGHPLLGRVERGQHQHRDETAPGAKPAADVLPRDAGQHQVQHDDVEVVVHEHLKRRLAVGSVLDHPSLTLEAAGDEVGDTGFVLDQQYVHVTALG